MKPKPTALQAPLIEEAPTAAEAATPAAPQAQPVKLTLGLINRAKMIEGRMEGVSFCFLKKTNDGEFRQASPLSSCKDYLNDVVYCEASGKPYTAHGFECKKDGVLDNGVWLYISSLENWKMLFCDPYTRTYAKPYKQLSEDIAWITGPGAEIILGFAKFLTGLVPTLNQDECVLLRPDGKEGGEGVILGIPKWWGMATYRISVFALLMRCAIGMRLDKIPDSTKSLEKAAKAAVSNCMDAGCVADGIQKLKLMADEHARDQDFSATRGWHSFGQSNWSPTNRRPSDWET